MDGFGPCPGSCSTPWALACSSEVRWPGHSDPSDPEKFLFHNIERAECVEEQSRTHEAKQADQLS